ncbi:MAG: hypothetical protein HC824_20355 [Synechococcales cyanobacterium RM1_1_8]|nr:hypothetical protein [Synechococcales cyanobacterium RM1_1_8]
MWFRQRCCPSNGPSALAQIAVAQAANCTAVVYTSRQVLSFETAAARLSLGRAVSQLFTFLLRNLPEIGFLITKGGITSNDSLSQGLELSQVRLLGQILPGISLVQLAPDHPRFPLLPVVLFPGNVGQADSLTLAHKRIAHPQDQLSK